MTKTTLINTNCSKCLIEGFSLKPVNVEIDGFFSNVHCFLSHIQKVRYKVLIKMLLDLDPKSARTSLSALQQFEVFQPFRMLWAKSISGFQLLLQLNVFRN